MVTPPRNRRVPYVAPPTRPVPRNVRRGASPAPVRGWAWRASLVAARCVIVGAFYALCILMDNI
jgi:hypothetical protein